MNKKKEILKFCKGDWECISEDIITNVYINNESVEVIRKRMDGTTISRDIFNTNNHVGENDVLLLNNLNYIIKDANETTLLFGAIQSPYIDITDNSINYKWAGIFKRI